MRVRFGARTTNDFCSGNYHANRGCWSIRNTPADGDGDDRSHFVPDA